MPADIIYTNGEVWTGNQITPWAEGLAVKGDKIIYHLFGQTN